MLSVAIYSVPLMRTVDPRPNAFREHSTSNAESDTPSFRSVGWPITVTCFSSHDEKDRGEGGLKLHPVLVSVHHPV